MQSSDFLAAERYAGAIFEIARPLGLDEEIEADLVGFSGAVRRSQALQKFLANPYFKVEEKEKVLKRILSFETKAGEVLFNFFGVLLRKNRFHLIHEIASAFKKIADQAQRQGTAHVLSARPLSAEEEKNLLSRLERLSGSRIVVKKAVDPSLIGGVRVRLDNRVWDGSVKGKLSRLREELTRIGTI